MRTVQSILLFTIAALLLVTFAIHGFVLVTTYWEKRAGERRKGADGSNIENPSD